MEGSFATGAVAAKEELEDEAKEAAKEAEAEEEEEEAFGSVTAAAVVARCFLCRRLVPHWSPSFLFSRTLRRAACWARSLCWRAFFCAVIAFLSAFFFSLLFPRTLFRTRT